MLQQAPTASASSIRANRKSAGCIGYQGNVEWIAHKLKSLLGFGFRDLDLISAPLPFLYEMEFPGSHDVRRSRCGLLTKHLFPMPSSSWNKPDILLRGHGAHTTVLCELGAKICESPRLGLEPSKKASFHIQARHKSHRPDPWL